MQVRMQGIHSPKCCCLVVLLHLLLLLRHPPPAPPASLSRNITFSRPLVLRGAGRGATTLFIPLSLEDLYGNTYTAGPGSSDWSFRWA